VSKAIQFSRFGPPEVLELVEVPEPQAGPGQVRLLVRAVGVNPLEYKMRSGARKLELPAGLGSELAGVVDQVGDGVSDFAVGDEVLGFSQTPSYAELALADPVTLVRKPAGIDWEHAGAIPVAARTAYTVLELLDLQPGETLLMHAAAGGVGIVAAQMALARGARVIGTASEANHEFLRSIGVEPVSYGDGLAERLRAIAPDGVDAVFDASGRGELPLSIELAGGPERVITIAAYDSADYGVLFAGPAQAAKTDPRVPFAQGAALIADGKLELPIWKTYPLADAAAAHTESERGHLRGKIILVP
jgi:NADPH:quinone reductase-like Zn-dependent oxidoreductase